MLDHIIHITHLVTLQLQLCALEFSFKQGFEVSVSHSCASLTSAGFKAFPSQKIFTIMPLFVYYCVSLSIVVSNCQSLRISVKGKSGYWFTRNNTVQTSMENFPVKRKTSKLLISAWILLIQKSLQAGFSQLNGVKSSTLLYHLKGTNIIFKRHPARGPTRVKVAK